jgi:hypothetical protein
MIGEKTGVWRDFATGESGNNLLNLPHKVRGESFRNACEETANWLSNPEQGKTEPCSLARREYGYILEFKQNKLEQHDFKDLVADTKRDRELLADVLGINVDGLLPAEQDIVLKFFDHLVNGRCSSVMDRQNYVRQDRRMDGKQFILRDGRTAKARTIGWPPWPVGIRTDKPAIIIIERSSDFLVAYLLMCAKEMEEYIAPVTMLGAASRIHDGALEYFR